VLNGTNVTSSFTYTTGGGVGCRSHASSTGTIALQVGSNSLTASINDGLGASAFQNAFYTRSAPAGNPVVSLAPNAGSIRDVSQCVADCFDNVVSYSTPSYRTFDQERALTLTYRSSQSAPLGEVTMDVRDTSSVRTASTISLKLLDNNGAVVTLATGLQEMYFTYQQNATSRITGQFDASTRTTGAYNYTAIVTSHYTDGTSQASTVPVRVVIVNEQLSPYGSGWNVAGLQRAYPSSSNGLLVTDGAGSAQFFAGACATAPCSFTSPLGDFSVMSRHAWSDGTVWDRRYPDGTVVVYSGNGLEAYMMDRFGNQTTYNYDANLRLVNVVDPTGQPISIASVGAGPSFTITDPAARVTTVTIAADRTVTDIQDPVGGHPFTSQSWYSTRLSQWTDRRGGVWNATYDCSGHLQTLTSPTVTVDGSAQRLATSMISPERVTSACGTGTGGAGTPAANVLAVNAYASTTNARGVATTFTLNALGAPTSVTDYLGRVTSITRDSMSRVTATATPSGHRTAAVWSGANVTQSVDSTTGQVLNYQYDSRYNLVTAVSGNTASVQNYVNSTGTRVDSVKVGGASATKYVYDSTGRVVSVTDPEGHTTRTHYQGSYPFNTDTVTAPGGRVTAYGYDAAGRGNRTTDALNRVTSTLADALGRTYQVTGPNGGVTRYVFDSLYLWKVTDALGQTYQYDRNALGWTETLTDPGLRAERFAYDANGNVTFHTNRRGQQDTTTYDLLDRPIRLGTSSQRTTTYAYDPAERWYATINAAGADTICLDATGRTIAEIAWRNGQRLTDTSTYLDPVGRRASATWENDSRTGFWAHRTTYGYDASMQLQTINGNTTLGYNNDRLASTVTYPGGLVKSDTYSSIHGMSETSFSTGMADYAFHVATTQDTIGRVNERFRRPTDAADTSRVYEYDAMGQLTSFTDLIRGQKTCHVQVDVGMQCTSPPPQYVRQEVYSYDLVGNRTDNASPVQPGDRLTAFNGYTLSYDADGDLVRKVKAGVADDSLEWNALGELTRVLRGGSEVASFTYDGLGRRATKTTSAGTTYYQWDGDNVVSERTPAMIPLVDYNYYPGVDRPYSVLYNYNEYPVAMDGSSVIGAITTGGSGIAAEYRYTPFGGMDRNDATLPGSLRFQARPYDAETGLYYFRARYYDPDLARFVSEDPIGLEGGINPYAFAGNDPVNAGDPSGENVLPTVVTMANWNYDWGWADIQSFMSTLGQWGAGYGLGDSGSMAHGGGSQRGSGSVVPAKSKCSNVIEFSGGISALVGGLGVIAPFLGGSLNGGINTAGQIFLSGSASATVGAGGYVGGGAGVGGGWHSSPYKTGWDGGTMTQVNANVGAVVSVGAQLNKDATGWSVSPSMKKLSLGLGLGAQVSVGPAAGFSLASPNLFCH
jgi:RHS repeat-associated core domain